MCLNDAYDEGSNFVSIVTSDDEPADVRIHGPGVDFPDQMAVEPRLGSPEK